ncbi:MAG TPA: metallophosphoesterase [Ideonella sp.]|nr:metallophosphoesterase [Ideonella sp.]
MRRSPVFILFALVHAYVAWRLLPAMLAWPAVAGATALALLGSALLVPFTLMGRHRAAGPLGHAVRWAGLLLMGLFSSLFVLTLVRDGVSLLLGLFELAAPGRLPWPAWWAASALAVAGGALAASLIGFVNARRTAAVVKVDVPMAGLPAALQGFTIAQISDIHVGPTIKAGYLQAIVDKVNRLQADMVAVTGDLVDGSVAELGAHVAPLAGLASRHGTFFVTGNHEYYSGADAWVAELRRLGLRVLMNQHALLQHGGAGLVVAGVTDYSAHHFDPTQRSSPLASLKGAPADAGARLLLAHQPRSAAAAAEAGFDLQLSGHTHGGQFLPWNLFVPLQQPFVAGLHKLRDLWVYTSRGTGYWGPPNRFGVPSEITLLRLVRA